MPRAGDYVISSDGDKIELSVVLARNIGKANLAKKVDATTHEIHEFIHFYTRRKGDKLFKYEGAEGEANYAKALMAFKAAKAIGFAKPEYMETFVAKVFPKGLPDISLTQVVETKCPTCTDLYTCSKCLKTEKVSRADELKEESYADFPPRPARMSAPCPLRMSEAHEHKCSDANCPTCSQAWSEKYKRSIDCSNPRGFSQRQHCMYGRTSHAHEMKSCPGCSQCAFGKVSGAWDTQEQNVEMVYPTRRLTVNDVSMRNPFVRMSYASDMKPCSSCSCQGCSSCNKVSYADSVRPLSPMPLQPTTPGRNVQIAVYPVPVYPMSIPPATRRMTSFDRY